MASNLVVVRARGFVILSTAIALLFASPLLAQSEGEIVFWQSVSDSGSVAQLQAYVDAYPNGVFRVLAELKIKELGGKAEAMEQAKPTPTLTIDPEVARAAMAECDRLAGHPADETLTLPPTAFSDLKSHAAQAIDACQNAHSASDEPRYTFQLARAYWASGDTETAWPLYQDAAEQGHSRAIFRTALIYYRGKAASTAGYPVFDVTPDEAKALALFRRNAMAGHDRSAYYAGWILLFGGDGVQRDYAAAFEFLVKAANAGDMEAMYPLGYMNEHGLHVRQSRDMAINLYRRGIDAEAAYANEMRKRLADILLGMFEGGSILETQDSVVHLLEAINLLHKRTPSGRDAHDEFVRVIIEAMQTFATKSGQALTLAMQDDAPIDMEPAKQMISGMRELKPILVRALNDRHTQYPNAYPEQTPARSQQMAEDLVAVLDRFAVATHEDLYVGSRRANKPASECVSALSYSNDETFFLSIKNDCDDPVELSARMLIRYDALNVPNDVSFPDGTLARSQSKTFRLDFSHNTAAKKTHYKVMACYPDEGFEVRYSESALESGWWDSRAECGSDGAPIVGDLDEVEERIRMLMEEITGPRAPE